MSAGNLFGTEQIPVEFPLVGGTLDSDGQVVGLYQCPFCSALVIEKGAQPHAKWHEEERMRNFSGF